MSRTFTALAFVAALGVALPATAQTISITIEGDARITIEQSNPPLIGLHHTPEQAKPIKPRHPNWIHKPGQPDWGHKLGQWIERNEQSQQHHDAPNQPWTGGADIGPFTPLLQDMLENNGAQHQAPNTPAHESQPTQQMENTPTHDGHQPMGRPFDGNKPQTIDRIDVTQLPDPSACNAKALESLIGDALPVGSKLTEMDLGSTVRVLTSGQPYTLDKRKDRATLVVDVNRIVQDAYCG